IDYGPCAFLDRYDPAKKFSYIDRHGRYAYGNQPNIAHWNLARLAEALLPLIDPEETAAIALATSTLERFPGLFQEAWDAVFADKTGFPKPSETSRNLAVRLLELMAEEGADFTLTFRQLRDAGGRENEILPSGFFNLDGARIWLGEWRNTLAAIGITPEEATARMRSSNPVFIPRNHRIEAIITAAKEHDFEPFHEFHRVLARPYEEQPESAGFESPPLPHEEVPATFCGT
ncbi:MAG: YdiU family protein, partial [Verrucomicrobiae bacterium]|nr:YdiU family protein [Verrucomicrobiae bacterium]